MITNKFCFEINIIGRVTVPGFTPYSMSKFAVVAFADGLRREMIKWRVSVHMIEPSAYKYKIVSKNYYFILSTIYVISKMF